jgi:hypothetical protein
MPKYCSECRKELSGNSEFCPNCGKQTEIKKNEVVYFANNQSWKMWLRNPVVIIILVFAIIGSSYGIYAYFSHDEGLTGTWEGSGTFTNGGITCTDPPCEYVGAVDPPSVVLELQQNGNYVFGTVTINIPDSQVQELVSGAGCTGFDNSVSDINNGILSGTRLTFMDDGGNIWTLNFLNNNCQGTVGSNAFNCTGLVGNIFLGKK